MKKQILFMFLLLVANSMTSQVQVVSAPALETLESTNLKNSINQLKESVVQTKNLQESLKMLRATVDILEKVNNVITTSNSVRGVFLKQIKLVKYINSSLKEIGELSTLKPSEISNINNRLSVLTDVVNKEILFLKKILTTGDYKMNNFQRLEKIEDIERHLDDVFLKVQHINNKYQKKHKDRMFFKKM